MCRQPSNVLLLRAVRHQQHDCGQRLHRFDSRNGDATKFLELRTSLKRYDLYTTPYMWDLIESQGLNVLQIPTLSRITVAGGALLHQGCRYAHLGRAIGWDLYVMYEQTEAARLVFPDLAFRCLTLSDSQSKVDLCA